MKSLVQAAHRQSKKKAKKASVKAKRSLQNAFGKIAEKKPVTRGAHVAARVAFDALGFEFEERVQGDLKLGLIRLRFKNPLQKLKPAPFKKRIKRAVFVPGFGDTPLSWLPILAPLRPVLATQVDELIIIDFPGFGGFLQNELAFDSMESLQNVFFDVMTTLQPEIMMGHSLGGWLSADYVSKTPVEKQPGKMILLDPSGLLGSEEQKLAFKELFETATLEGFSALRKHVFMKEPIWFSWLAYEFGSFIKRPEIQSFVRSIEDSHLVEKRLGHVSCATWVVWGDKDTMTPTQWIDHWLSSLKHVDAKGVLIKNSGHSPHVEKPAATLAVLTQIILGMNPISIFSNPFWRIVQPST